MHHRSTRNFGVAVAIAALTATVNAEVVELDRGINLSVSTREAFPIIFDLGGQLWQLDQNSPRATQVGSNDRINARPALSPDGRHVAYESVVGGYHQIFVTDLTAGSEQQITFGPYDHRTPNWSPRAGVGFDIAMSANRAGSFDIWSVNTHTLELTQLTFAKGIERDPAWNETGLRLAYVSETPATSAIHSLIPGSEPVRVVRERNSIAGPAWRPGGGVITYTRVSENNAQLRMLILSSPPITKPISQTELVLPFPAQFIGPDRFIYSADGKIRQRIFGERDFTDVRFVAAIDLPRASATGQVNNPTENSAAARSETGATSRSVAGIAGMTQRDDGMVIAAALGDLWEFRDDAGALELTRQLTSDAFVDAQPVFSPSGDRIVFASDRGGSVQVWIRSIESGRQLAVTRERFGVSYPAWHDNGQEIGYFAAEDPQGLRYSIRSVVVEQRKVSTEKSGLDSAAPLELVDGVWQSRHADANQSDDAIRLPAIPLTWRPATAPAKTVLRVGRLFDGIGPGYLERQDIIIEGGRIVEIRASTDGPDDGQLIDLADKTIVPGFLDLAVRQRPMSGERLGRQWLASGVTTIRESVERLDEAVERRESWLSGKRIGPRLVLAAKICVDDNGSLATKRLTAMLSNATRLGLVTIELCDEIAPDDLRAAIAQIESAGLTASVAASIPGLQAGAHEVRPPQSSSIFWSDFLEIGAQAGVTMTSQLLRNEDPGNQLMRDVATTWSFPQIFTRADRGAYQAVWRKPGSRRGRITATSLNTVVGRGAGLVIGSAAPRTPPGLGLHAEMRLLATRGLQPFQILKMASLDAARAIGLGDQVGLIRTGYRADLVVLNSDPLTDINAAADLHAVVVGGRYFTRQAVATPGQRSPEFGPGVGKLYNNQPAASPFLARNR